ncbi:MAG: hypothetical protein ABSB19_05160 [Methylomonas sp.]|jgi:hypothetical protein
MNIDLKQLPQLQALFKLLSSGSHLNRLQETELWMALENQQANYEALFSAIGFTLLVDGRGFAYFKTDQASSYTGKFSRGLALLLMLLFEYQADQGLQLFQFQQWRIEWPLIDKLYRQYHVLLEAEEIESAQALKEILDRAVRAGFAVFDDNAYWLLAAVHRYLDLFEELALADRPELEAFDVMQDGANAELEISIPDEEVEEDSL